MFDFDPRDLSGLMLMMRQNAQSRFVLCVRATALTFGHFG